MRHTGPISGVAALTDRYVATAGYDNRVILWDARSGQALARGWHDHLANQCAFNHDGSMLVSASSDYSARLWALPAMRMTALLAGHEDDVEMAVFSPDGESVATCSRDLSIRVFNLDGSCRLVLRGHAADVISVTWSPDGTELISSSDDGTVRRWDAGDGRELSRTGAEGVETDTLCVSRTGVLFAGDDLGRISIMAGDRIDRIDAHDAGIKRVVWDEAGQRLLSLSYDRTVRVWRYTGAGRLEPIGGSSLPAVVWPRSAAFADDDKVHFATFGSSFATWSIGTDCWSTEAVAPTVSVNAVLAFADDIHTIGDAGIWSVDGHPRRELGSLCNFLVEFDGSLITGGQMGAIFDARSGATIHTHRSPLNCAATFMRNGKPHAIIGAYTGEGLVVARDDDGRLRVQAEIPLHDGAIKGIASDGVTIFSVCANADAAFHDVATYALVERCTHAHQRIANGCCTVGRGVYASVSRDLQLRIWQIGQVEAHPSPHRHSIKCVATGSDGGILATGGYDGTVALFDIAARRWIGTCRASAGGISSLCAGSGGFLAGGYDGHVYRITVRAGEVVAERYV